jgi:hypothetical protein
MAAPTVRTRTGGVNPVVSVFHTPPPRATTSSALARARPSLEPYRSRTPPRSSVRSADPTTMNCRGPSREHSETAFMKLVRSTISRVRGFDRSSHVDKWLPRQNGPTSAIARSVGTAPGAGTVALRGSLGRSQSETSVATSAAIDRQIPAMIRLERDTIRAYVFRASASLDAWPRRGWPPPIRRVRSESR